MNKKIKIMILIFAVIFSIVLINGCLRNTGAEDISYAIKFESDGGSFVTSIKTDGKSAVIMPRNPTKIGYIFKGWFRDNGTFNDEFTANSLIDSPIDNNLNLYAKWQLIETEEDKIYVINFNCNGGSVVSSISQKAGTAIAEPSEPAYEGFVFVGWYTDSALTKDFAFNVMPSRNIWLFAKWDVFVEPGFIFNLINDGSEYEVGWENFDDEIISINIPELYNGKKITAIAEEGFAYLRNLQTVFVSKNIITIGKDAFFNIYGKINSIVVDTENTAFKAIDGVLFDKAETALLYYPSGKEGDSYSILPSITTVGEKAFYGNYNLKVITLNNDLTNIGNEAFWGCSALEAITIPESVTNIGIKAFSSCINLLNISVNLNSTHYKSLDGVLFNRDMESFTLICYPAAKAETNYALPEDVRHIENGAFSSCYNLKEIILSKYLISIGNSAFVGCNELEKIVIPVTTTIIDDNAFGGCYNLVLYCEAESLPEAWNENWNCDGLPVVWASNGIIPGTEGLSYKLKANNTYEVESIGEATDTDILIPEIYKGLAVTSIGWGAFSESVITSVIISKNITFLDVGAFFKCASLATVTVSESVTDISDTAFQGCKALTSITVDAENPNFKSVNGGLYNKMGTELICIPSILAGANYTILGGVESIGAYAFCDYINLTSITFSDSVKEISEYAFAECTGITEIIFTENLEYIGNYAFYGCTSLSVINVMKNSSAGIITCGYGLFDECSAALKIYVTDSASVTAYKNAENWSDYEAKIYRMPEVIFETNGGGVYPQTIVPYNTLLSAPPEPLKEGKTFEGWFTDNDLRKQ